MLKRRAPNGAVPLVPYARPVGVVSLHCVLCCSEQQQQQRARVKVGPSTTSGPAAAPVRSPVAVVDLDTGQGTPARQRLLKRYVRPQPRHLCSPSCTLLFPILTPRHVPWSRSHPGRRWPRPCRSHGRSGRPRTRRSRGGCRAWTACAGDASVCKGAVSPRTTRTRPSRNGGRGQQRWRAEAATTTSTTATATLLWTTTTRRRTMPGPSTASAGHAAGTATASRRQRPRWHGARERTRSGWRKSPRRLYGRARRQRQPAAS